MKDLSIHWPWALAVIALSFVVLWCLWIHLFPSELRYTRSSLPKDGPLVPIMYTAENVCADHVYEIVINGVPKQKFHVTEKRSIFFYIRVLPIDATIVPISPPFFTGWTKELRSYKIIYRSDLLQSPV